MTKKKQQNTDSKRTMVWNDILSVAPLSEPGEPSNAVNVRVAMIARGEDPANNMRVQEILNMRLAQTMEYTSVLNPSLQLSGTVEYGEDTATLTPVEGKAITIRAMLGRDGYLLEQMDNEMKVFTTLTDAQEKQLRGLSLGDRHMLMEANSFLTPLEVIRKHLPE